MSILNLTSALWQIDVAGEAAEIYAEMRQAEMEWLIEACKRGGGHWLVDMELAH